MNAINLFVQRLMRSDVRTTLSIEPCHRSEEQLHMTISWIKRAVEAFSDFPPELQRSLVMVGWYEQLSRESSSLIMNL